jgi:hypothetical protein
MLSIREIIFWIAVLAFVFTLTIWLLSLPA